MEGPGLHPKVDAGVGVIAAPGCVERAAAPVGSPTSRTDELARENSPDQRATGEGRSAGRVTTKRAPAPRPSLAAVTRPPWASTSALTIASPMPDPPLARSRAVSTR